MKQQVFEYVVQPGDTLGGIARNFTGHTGRWKEMLESNPQIPKQRDSYGEKRFVASHFQVGQRIYLPLPWAHEAGLVNGPADGQLGAANGSSCNPGAKSAVKPYFYECPGPSTEVWGQIATNFNLGVGHISELNRANVGQIPGGFAIWNDVCGPAKYEAGQLIAIPASWPEPTDPTVIARLRDGAGGKYVPGQAAPTCPDGSLWDPDQKKCIAAGGIANVTPTCETGYHYDTAQKTCVQDGGAGQAPPICPAGTVYDSATGLCTKGAGTPVGAKDEGIKTSTILWILLAAGAGIGGALLLNNLIKAKRVHGPYPPSSMPALPAHKEEVVVRR
jgi:hypothetical protein